MTAEESQVYLRDLPDWELRGVLIQKEFRFRTYIDGLEFSYRFGKLAESQNHHPDMVVNWRRVKVSLSTHVIKGLSLNDFVMAAKAELEYERFTG